MSDVSATMAARRGWSTYVAILCGTYVVFTLLHVITLAAIGPGLRVIGYTETDDLQSWSVVTKFYGAYPRPSIVPVFLPLLAALFAAFAGWRLVRSGTALSTRTVYRLGVRATYWTYLIGHALMMAALMSERPWMFVR